MNTRLMEPAKIEFAIVASPTTGDLEVMTRSEAVTKAWFAYTCGQPIPAVIGVLPSRERCEAMVDCMMASKARRQPS